MSSRVFLFLFLFSLPANATAWIEDSLSLQFNYPRGWMKHVTRSENFMKVDFYRPEGARITIDSYKRNDPIDLDRYIEYRIDLMLKSFPDLKIKTEKKFGASAGFDNVIFIVVNYTEKEEIVSDRILFTKKADTYYSVQCKTLLKQFNIYKKYFDIVTKSFHFKEYQPGKWRNDSILYLDPSKDASMIQKIFQSEPNNNDSDKTEK